MRYRFGIFEFDNEAQQLTRSGHPVRLEAQPARALSVLLSRRGEVVTKTELREAIWAQDTHVDFDRGIAYCLSEIRAALDDSGANPRFVQTLPKVGYRMLVPVTSPELPSRRALWALPAAASLAGAIWLWSFYGWNQGQELEFDYLRERNEGWDDGEAET